MNVLNLDYTFIVIAESEYSQMISLLDASLEALLN